MLVYSFDLTGKVILITGGYGYLGRGITSSLLHHGATVYVLGRYEEKFKDAFPNNVSGAGQPGVYEPEDTRDGKTTASAGKKSDAPETGNWLCFQQCDISDSGSVSGALKSVFEKEGQIDCLINNAFYLKGQDPLAMSDDEWQHGIDGTLNSVFRCIREAIPYLEKSTAPRIINVSSMYGMVAPDFAVYEGNETMMNPPHYGAAKAGVLQLTRYYASFLGRKGITVNCVTPGPFPSDAVREKEDFVQALSEKTCLKRIGRPEDLGGVFVFLSSDTSAYMTGQNLVVDGGWTVV